MSIHRTAAIAALILTGALAGCQGPYGNMRLRNPFVAQGTQASVEPVSGENREAIYTSMPVTSARNSGGDTCSNGCMIGAGM